MRSVAPDKTGKRARPIRRIFAGIVAVPFAATGVISMVAEFPFGLLAGLSLIGLGVAAAYYAWRGRQPSWFQG